jgi:hypothetical protein
MPKTADADAIEVEYQEVPSDPSVDPSAPTTEPRPIDGPAPLTRSDVLRCARALNSQIVGMSGAIETAAFTPGRIRPEFLRAWHAWCGAFLADAARLERVIFKAQDEAAMLARYGAKRDWWRQGIAEELKMAAAVGAASEVKQPEPISARSWRRWPLFVIIPASVGVVVGSYLSVRWMFRQLVEGVQTAGDREQSGEEK